jgi:opacity protein-like surface antigen
MSIFSRKLALALVLVALCLGARTAHAQAAPVPYWIPGGPVGFGGNLTFGQSSNAYGNFAGLDGNDARGGGFSTTRYNFSNGWFVGGEGGGIGLGLNGLNQSGAFGNFPSLYYQGAQVGYDFKNAGGLPLKVYAGFDTLKYDPGTFAPIGFTSGTLSGYSAHAGVEYQPAQNLSLSLGVGYTQIQQSGAYNNISSPLLPAASMLDMSGRR